MKASTLMVAGICVALAACGDEITNIYNSVPTAGVAGWVVPPDPGTTVSTADGQLATTIDDDGYFVLTGIPVGNFHVVVQPVNFSRREIRGTLQTQGELVLLSDISLSNHPYPVYRVNPIDGDDSVGAGYGYSTPIRIYCDEALIVEDLAEHTTFAPALVGTWNESPRSYGDALQYDYWTSDAISLATVYTVTIDQAVRTQRGGHLNGELSWRFTTIPLTVAFKLPMGSSTGNASVDHFRPAVSLNACVGFDAFLQAVAFDPPLPGIWSPERSCTLPEGATGIGSYKFGFSPASAPLRNTEYRLIVSDTVELLPGVRLASPAVAVMRTEGYSVTDVFPQTGATWATADVRPRLTFSAAMDTASTEAAFHLIMVGGPSIAGDFSWESDHAEFRYVPTAPLTRNRVYRITLSEDARAADGSQLTAEFESYFAVQ